MQRKCVICSAVFDTTHARKIACKTECAKKLRREKSKRWAQSNPEKVAESNKQTQRRRLENGKFREYQLKRRSSKAGYLDRFLERARATNPSTNLTREYLAAVFGDSCSVTGVPFSFDRKLGTGFQNPFAPSIDRIDSSKPYEVGNVQIVLTAVNFAKSEMSMEDFINVWKHITKSWAALTQGQY